MLYVEPTEEHINLCLPSSIEIYGAELQCLIIDCRCSHVYLILDSYDGRSTLFGRPRRIDAC